MDDQSPAAPQVAASLEELASWVGARSSANLPSEALALLNRVQNTLRKRALEIREKYGVPGIRHLGYTMVESAGSVEDRHESFGLLEVTRSNVPKQVFGFAESPVPQTIQVKVTPAKRFVDKYTGKETIALDPFRRPIVQFELSFTQWAELVGGVGLGNQIPCTLLQVQGLTLEETPSVKPHFQVLAESLLQEVMSYTESNEEYQLDIESLQQQVRDLGLNKANEKQLLKRIQSLGRRESEPLQAARFAAVKLREIITQAVSSAKLELQKFRDTL